MKIEEKQRILFQCNEELVEKVTRIILNHTTPYFDLRGNPCLIWDTNGYDEIIEYIKKEITENEKNIHN